LALAALFSLTMLMTSCCVQRQGTRSSTDVRRHRHRQTTATSVHVAVNWR